MFLPARRRSRRRQRSPLSRRACLAGLVLALVGASADGTGLAAQSAEAEEPASTARGSRAKGQRIARVAQEFKGCRYKPGGNSPRGFDCSGFTQFVVKKTLGLDIGQSVPPQWKVGKRVGTGKWRPGDLVFFENTFERGLSHVGIYLERGRFIHAENEDTGVVISRIDSDYYAAHYYGARRLT